MSQDDATHAPSAPFKDSCALIYGAGQGIGRAVALEFARRGARVAIADINVPGAQETAAAIKAIGGEAAAFACDVTREDSIREVADQAERALGDVDIVMNNVGVITNGNPEDIPLDEWRRIIDLNLFSVIYSNQVFIPKLTARGRGHIVNTASFAGLYPYAANRMPYVASKAAVIALSESMALYLHPQGVRVSCLCPGPVATGVMNAMKSWSENIPFRGPGAQYKVATVEQAAVTLANGMCDGRVIIPTDDKVWEVIRRHAASPDAFIQDKIDEVARGEFGKPSM
ncbi:SDR family NAD(P)-dependent oxidoreductase [Phenylobacterium sp. LjRoot225]|uniref:SDR family NAD(P)-dependent oxidoreductase n=1 Tax=Phenylobacterium sp. LjRoot225 TaxID=3342285 RepID=UPI003ECF9342